jgi:diguanylate cyclase (GGDEF)-like protein
MDPFIIAAGAASTVSIVAAVWFRNRARRAETETALQRREIQAERHAAHHDPLTGLLNRRTFYQLATAQLADPPARPMVAVLVNMDDFTRINTAYGHRVGDQLLASFARRFADYTTGNLVARVDGDEFAALLPCSAAPGAGVYPDARSLSRLMAGPIWAGGHYLQVTASVGLATVTSHSDLDDVLRRAAAAMRSAKAKARTRPLPPTMTIHGTSVRYPAPSSSKAHILPRRCRRRVRTFRIRLSAGRI